MGNEIVERLAKSASRNYTIIKNMAYQQWAEQKQVEEQKQFVKITKTYKQNDVIYIGENLEAKVRNHLVSLKKNYAGWKIDNAEDKINVITGFRKESKDD